jgi:hypothetical protein
VNLQYCSQLHRYRCCTVPREEASSSQLLEQLATSGIAYSQSHERRGDVGDGTVLSVMRSSNRICNNILLVHFLPGLVGIVFDYFARPLGGVGSKVFLNDDAILVDHECHHPRSPILSGISQESEPIGHIAID